ncbi:hypothetical protein ACFQMF_07535 [Halorubrum rutilum]|uniref:Uncharacterized protein n=1 Tax=Halorubrum rutilum TaxID=1364933 RepID=A0ABD6AJF3_9EURY|nr:hypothetical protein [Halorubrum rutilum]
MAVLLRRVDRPAIVRGAVVRRSIECPAVDGADGTGIGDGAGIADADGPDDGRDGFRALPTHVDV